MGNTRKTRGSKKPASNTPTEYERGYAAGYKAGRRSALAEFDTGAPPRRPSLYQFDQFEVGQVRTFDEPSTVKVYNAARKWAQRNAPSRRFACRPANGKTKVTRTQ